MSELTRVLEEFRRRNRVPAIIGAVTDRDGLLESHAVGMNRRGPSADAVTAHDRWHIGSCGKSITAVLWARLVEAGLTDWNVSIRSLFPDLADIDSGWTEPTIDDLLRCTAGVSPNPPRAQLRQLWDCGLGETEQRTEAARSTLSSAPHQPGQFRYSNLGYVLVGAAIDRIAGVPFEKALRVHVLEPLGMESLGFGPPPHVWGHRPRLQLGPFVAGRGVPANPSEARSDNPPLLTPAGRMHLSIDDWGAFHRVFLNGGRPLLETSTIRHILEIPSADLPSMAMGWASAAGLGASYAMQGSNTMWAATALIDKEMAHTAMVVTNDGRTKVLRHSAELAVELIAAASTTRRPTD